MSADINQQIAAMIVTHEKEKAALREKIQTLEAISEVLCHRCSDQIKRIAELEQFLSGKPKESAA